jgi:ribulose-5-phosphate 4-epimerase/fuculose-1-phosphate aldolase
LFDEQVRFLGKAVELVPYGASGTSWLSSNIIKKLKSRANAYLLKNHGALTLGPDPERAMFNVELLEKVTTAYLLSYYTGERITHIPVPIREIILMKLKKSQRRQVS